MKIIISDGFKKLAYTDYNTMVSLEPGAFNTKGLIQQLLPKQNKKKMKKRRGRISPTDEQMPKGML